MSRGLLSVLERATLCIARSFSSISFGSAQQSQLPERPDLDNQLAYQRAVEAVIWSMPAISIREFWESAFKDYSATWNDIILWSKPVGPQHELLTANNQVPYLLTTIDLRQGPVVVEIPAAGEKALLFGSFVDNWQAPIVDVGPSGTDEGHGGKYSFIPPGYTAPIPEGYLPVKSEGYVVAGGLRPVPAEWRHSRGRSCLRLADEGLSACGRRRAKADPVHRWIHETLSLAA